jgi:hypothetical protein
MFKISYKDVNGPLPGALSEIRQMQFNAKVSYTISKICEKVEQAMKKGRDGYQEILKKYVELDEKGAVKPVPPEAALDPNGKPLLDPKGNPLMTPGAPFKYKDESQKSVCQKEVETWLENTFIEVPTRKLTLDDFGQALISPECLEVLEPVLAVPGESSGHHLEVVQQSQ